MERPFEQVKLGFGHQGVGGAGHRGRLLPHRLLGLGVGRQEPRRYGRPDGHVAAHSLDPHGLHARFTGFLGARP